jgi:hypothetical protein
MKSVMMASIACAAELSALDELGRVLINRYVPFRRVSRSMCTYAESGAEIEIAEVIASRMASSLLSFTWMAI